MDDRLCGMITESTDQPAAVEPVGGRRPNVKEPATPVPGLGRPSDALAENLRAYRMLRRMTQDQLASRMAHLCHGWGRSTVSAVEGKSRNVTIDELFGLAVSVGVTIGELLDPTGPDHRRPLSLDVGLRATDGGVPQPVAPRLARLWASSRAVIMLWHDDGRSVKVAVAEEAPPATQGDFEGLGTDA
jgi:transcriptional regulator with XRE-family HTH domain